MNANQSYLELSQDEAIEKMKEDHNYLIVDVRREEEFVLGHLPNAINIPNEVIYDVAENILTDKNQELFVYCRSGVRSKQAAQKLADLGFSNVIEIGGIITWPGEITK